MSAQPDNRRILERSLAIRDGFVACPRRGSAAANECEGCAYFCRRGIVAETMTCSYPFASRDTFARRGRRRVAAQIALSHHLQRT